MAIDPISAKAFAAAMQKTSSVDNTGSGLQGVLGGQGAQGSQPAQGAAGSFTDSLKQLIDSVDESASTANDAINGMVTGSGDVHHAMIALQRAEQMLELTVQVRNKLVQAYQDVMRMPM